MSVQSIVSEMTCYNVDQALNCTRLLTYLLTYSSHANRSFRNTL